MISLLIFAIMILLSISLFVKSRKQTFQIWKNLGIQGPEPSIFLGNNMQFYKHPLNFVSEMVKKFGKISGFYIGPIPVMIVKDLEIIKDVLVRKFDNFTNRTKYPLLEVNPLQDSVLSLRDERWRFVRSILSPFFTGSKLKKSINIMSSASDMMVGILGKHEDEVISIYEPSQRYVIDVLLQCVLGVKDNVQNNMKHGMFLAVQSFSSDMRSILLKIGYIFPSLTVITNRLTKYFSQGKKLKDTQTYIEQIIEKKKNNNFSKASDYLSLLLKHNRQAGNGDEALTSNELLAATLSFVLVGFDSTASAISYCLYLLSHHKEEQEDLYDEIQQIVGPDGKLSYEDLMYRMPILDQIYKESLRMYPPFPVFSTRECKETYHKNGVTIPAGTSVMIPIKELHYDEDLWDQPETFMPSRFSPDNASKIPPLAYQPFLDGSRNCIGKNLGILISKMVIVKMVMQYEILPTTSTLQTIESGIPTSAVNYPKSGTNIKLKIRK